MRFDKLKKQLELIILLSNGSNYSVQDLCERMDLSRRNLWYCLKKVCKPIFFLSLYLETLK